MAPAQGIKIRVQQIGASGRKGGKNERPQSEGRLGARRFAAQTKGKSADAEEALRCAQGVKPRKKSRPAVLPAIRKSGWPETNIPRGHNAKSS